MWQRSFLPVALGLCVISFAVQADEPLQNDLSRGQLFTKYILPNVQGGGQVLSLDRDFIYPDDVAALKKLGNPFVLGVDVSHHNTDGCNCRIDWVSVFDSGATFVYMKASQGTSYFDKTLPVYWKGISGNPKEKTLLKGAFHFLSADGTGEEQGRYFVDNLDKQLASIGAKLRDDDLPPVVDLEWDHRVDSRGRPIPCSDNKIHRDCWELVPSAEIISRLTAWISTVQTLTKRTPIVYTARTWVHERIKTDASFSATVKVIWAADYLAHDKTGTRTIVTINPPTLQGVTSILWQYSDRAQMPDNVNLDGVDSDIYKGSESAFRKAFNLPALAPRK